MVKSAKVLAIVPARGGSKSIPRKNIKLLGGVPLIAYSIAAGLQAQTVDRVIVSTDDPEIADIARQWGSEVPFMRPAELAEDDTPDLPVFQHALRWLEENEGYRPEIVVQLRPTSPFRRLAYIDNAVNALIRRPDADAVRTVCVPFQNPFKMWTIDQEGFLRPLLEGQGPEPYNMPRQKLPQVYWQTGCVDATRWGTIMQLESMTGRRILPLIVDASDWVDIDSPADWLLAEQLLGSGQLRDLGFSLAAPLQPGTTVQRSDTTT